MHYARKFPPFSFKEGWTELVRNGVVEKYTTSPG